MNKILTITNGAKSIDIECTKTIITKVSEECLNQFTYKHTINPKEVVLTVLMRESNINLNELNQWRLIENENNNSGI